MLRPFSLLLVTFLYMNGVQCRSLWDADLHEFRNLKLESGKPIQVPNNYSEVQICELDGTTLYSDTLSQLEGVNVLRICRSNINEIQSGAFCSAPALKSLELDFYDSKNTPVLKKQHFENCDKIEELILIFDKDNDTYRIDTDALEGVSNLKHLYIQGYNLKHLSNNFLKLSPTLLTTLALSFVNIHEIDEDTFESFVNLENLVIIHNRQLETIPKELFKNNRKLKSLILRDNSIKDLTFDEFEGLNNLEALSLGSNRIANFDADKIAKNLPNLKGLAIDLNPSSCKSKEAFANDLKSKLKHPIDIEYKFDPGYYDPCEEEN